MSNYNRFQEKLKTKEERLLERAEKELSKKPIPKVSAKRIEENKQYEKVKKELKKKIRVCQIAIAGVCTKGPLEAHHKAGRIGDNLTDARKLILCCRACHSYCENHPAFAKRHGFSLSRLSKEK